MTKTILLTNDDGIHAPGLEVLERIAHALSDDVWVVAPEYEQSGAAHSLSLHSPVRVRDISEKRFAVSGTPTDCVLLALKNIMPAAPALILSGVNRGSNAGDDISYSGTVAGAMEGTLLGIPSIALSQLFYDGQEIHWQTAERYAPGVINQALKAGWPQGTFLNLNFPARPPENVEGIALCPQGKRVNSIALHARSDPRGRPYFWIGGDRDNDAGNPDVDVAKLDAGYVTLTPVRMDMTDYTTLEKFRPAFTLE